MLYRPPRTLAEYGLSRTQYYEQVNAGLLTKPVKIGDRAAATPASEVEILKKARIAGLAEAEIKAIVVKLHAERDVLAAELRASLKGAS
ncbi:MAG: transcriptional regulator [Burkholderiales bacterium]|nr:transcriptional regulator [Burkholderiales bacterium]